MKNRRSFLKMLGLGAVAAPVAAKMAVEAVPVMPAPLAAEYLSGRQIMLMQQRGVLELQREINRRRSAALKMLNENHRLWITAAARKHDQHFPLGHV